MKAIPLSRFTFDATVDRGDEKNELPSRTTPNQTLGLRDLLRRFSRGQAVATFDPVYDDDPDMPDVSKLSPIELAELRKDVADEIEYQRSVALERKIEEQNMANASKTDESNPDDAIIVDDPAPGDADK